MAFVLIVRLKRIKSTMSKHNRKCFLNQIGFIYEFSALCN